MTAPTITAIASSALAAVAGHLAHARARFWEPLDALAQWRLYRAEFDTQMYRGRYHHSSKNDDDLPIVCDDEGGRRR